MAQKGGGQGSVWSTLSALDAFPKVNEDFFKKTMSGGTLSRWAQQRLQVAASLY